MLEEALQRLADTYGYTLPPPNVPPSPPSLRQRLVSAAREIGDETHYRDSIRAANLLVRLTGCLQVVLANPDPQQKAAAIAVLCEAQGA